MQPPFEIALIVPPALEPEAAAEARGAGFAVTGTAPGLVTLTGGWPEVWRANLTLRGATRVLVRLGSFRAPHLAQLDKRARRFDWAAVLPQGATVAVSATCTGSQIWHEGAAAERIGNALRDGIGATIADDAPLRLRARIDDDLCTLSLDTTGDPLHKRGHKLAVAKAPLRETLAALFLMRCGFTGAEPVVDPMCGSGTIPIEAAEMAAGLLPGRSRTFAFEALPGFDPVAFAALKAAPPRPVAVRFDGFDRDDGAIRMSTANADRAGVAALTRFRRQAVSDLTPPDGPPGLVLTNPPYGARIGERRLLHALYGAFGRTLADRFRGWRVGIVTADDGLAASTGLPFLPPDPAVPHGGLRIRLWRTLPLG